MVTAELALALVGVAAVAVVSAWVIAVLAVMIRTQDTAAEVARQEARGDVSASKAVRQDAVPGSVVDVTRRAGTVTVTVVVEARPWADWLPGVPVRAQASVIVEEG